VLVFFFIVPLFGTVILGMLWKRATPAGGFWGFVVAILASMGMWGFVHTFPDGYRPQPKITLGSGAIVSLEKTDGRLTGIRVERGEVDGVNVPMPRAAPAFVVSGADLVLPGTVGGGVTATMQVLAPDVRLSDTNATEKFGVEGVPVTLAPGVRVTTSTVSSRFAPAAFNPAHTRYIARSEKAKPMAVNMYSGWWSLVVCVLVTVIVSLFTKPKPEHELTNLVMGLTPIPDPGPCPWYENPKLWAAAIMVVLIAINVIFW
jgi:Na+/proline symporter